MTEPKTPWKEAGTEPSLESLFVDPVLLTMLARNGVSIHELRDLSVKVGERLRLRKRPAPFKTFPSQPWRK